MPHIFVYTLPVDCGEFGLATSVPVVRRPGSLSSMVPIERDRNEEPDMQKKTQITVN